MKYVMIVLLILVSMNLPIDSCGQTINSEPKENQRLTGYVMNTLTYPFLLTVDGKPIGDPFPVYWDGVWHICAPNALLTKIVHFTSTDLVKWPEHMPAMEGPDIATGTVVRNDNKYYLFY